MAKSKTNTPAACIYKITSPSGKIYIGQTFNLAKRWGQYRNGYSKKQAKLHASFQKYGVEAHLFDLLCSLPADIHQVVLDRHEQLYMDLYRESGYEMLNLRGAGSSGKLSAETRAKLKGRSTKWLTGRSLTPEAVAKRTAKQRGMKRSEETKRKIAEAKRGDKNPRFGREPWNKGKPHSEETRQNLRRAWVRRKAREADHNAKLPF